MKNRSVQSNRSRFAAGKARTKNVWDRLIRLLRPQGYDIGIAVGVAIAAGSLLR